MALRGNALIGQGGGPTTVINASLLGIAEEARAYGHIERILGMRFGILGLLGDQLLDLGAESPERLRRVGHSPSAALGTCRRRFTSEDAETALSILASYNIRFFFYIGGNDSAETAHAIQSIADRHAYDLRCIGVPKTIDNDLSEMDHTPGYGSIARYIAISARDCAYDAASILPSDQVTILEVMGRNAGWVAAASALARTSPDDPPHAIYVPERPLTANQVVRDTELAVRRHGYAVLVVTETVRDEHGKPWARRTGDDGFGHARLTGAAERLGALIEEKLKLRARFNKPGTLQRASGGCVSNVDWDEAYVVGKTAVRSAVDGARDVMVTLLRRPGPVYACSTGLAPLTSIANSERRLPPDFLDDEGHITPAFVNYARPLIGGDLPQYATLAGVGPEGRD